MNLDTVATCEGIDDVKMEQKTTEKGDISKQSKTNFRLRNFSLKARSLRHVSGELHGMYSRARQIYSTHEMDQKGDKGLDLSLLRTFLVRLREFNHRSGCLLIWQSYNTLKMDKKRDRGLDLTLLHRFLVRSRD